MALGADRRRVARMVMRRALGDAALGLAVGLPVAVAATRLLRAQLWGVSELDGAVWASAWPC